MSADVPTDPPAADGYLERATLLAELGRYDEAVAELGFALSLDPAAAEVSTMLARVHLAAGRPAEALTAAEAAVAAAPGQLPPLVARGLALGDLERYGDAARTADEILALGPEDAYAQRSGAAILAGSRNGQPALNAAWHGVELAPEEPQGHLVLGLVAANMQMYDLAERAYREALRLDPRLAEVSEDVGVLRLEQRRWSATLEQLAEAAVASMPPDSGRRDGTRTDPNRSDTVPDDLSGLDQPREDPRRGETPDERKPGQGGPSGPTAGQGGDDPFAAPVDAGPVGPVADRTVPAALRQLVVWGAGWSVIAAVVVACSAATGPGFSRLMAVLAAAGGGIVVWRQASRLPGLTRTVLPVLRRTDRTLAFAVYGACVAPVLILLYALLGTPWPLVLAIGVAMAAQLAIVTRPVA
ncbi:tetratricopeptide repeat protein [Micromonospora craniellae]|uniref:Uncharacterized protein n=1 Tax=Micromonospora craniellae TaxID=2294034 RepID=A0A372FX67_9ACTN|nr:tetratricopeptide repeat protein [Micromonospora craniellae]QOC90012.1 tetratricopeptide repeat protein [Micromonospora craniellae]RFS45214.1 hypothetical protein D0Q02_17425 [Micromonospora craniellae]